jgi:hypothetical protein
MKGSRRFRRAPQGVPARWLGRVDFLAGRPAWLCFGEKLFAARAFFVYK